MQCIGLEDLHVRKNTLALYRVAQNTRVFLRVNNFATVSDRKACDVSKVCKFCLEKSDGV